MHPKSQQILEVGAIVNAQQYRGSRTGKLVEMSATAQAICGHNIIAHDLPLLHQCHLETAFFEKPSIDTLYLSVLLFPKKPYHPLVKEYKLDGDEMNNPIADAVLAMELLSDLMVAYQQLPTTLQAIYYQLLKDEAGFNGFFKLFDPPTAYHKSSFSLNALPVAEPKIHEQEALTIASLQTLAAATDNPTSHQPSDLIEKIQQYFSPSICAKATLDSYVQAQPTALAFALAFISVNDADSLLPNWVKHQFPDTLAIINELRVNCMGISGCPYCQYLSPTKGLYRFFGFESFRKFEGESDTPLQQQVVEAALANQSLLAIFPTGGGKSLTFQLPALMKGAANRSLTVVISPLQSLMKDQVDVLRTRHDVTTAITINGMLSPLERREALDRVENGGVNLLYISPESLRSKTITRLLQKRIINRFVIDEAHCFSSWGQDFRVDYLYIGKFIKNYKQINA